MEFDSKMLSFFPHRKTTIIFFLLLISSISLLPPTKSQPSPTTSNSEPAIQSPYANFSPSIAIIIVVLVAALFFMGFFSIYIRHCAEDNSGGSVRNLLSMNARRANAGPRGVEESVLETFPTFSYAEVKDHKVGKGALECAVCLNEFEDQETLRLIPRCDHVFHAECIDAWLQGHVTCPVCRADLTPKPGEELPDINNHDETVPETSSSEPDDVTVRVDDDTAAARDTEVKRNLSFRNLKAESSSVRGGRKNGLGFRSHSTGHSLVLPGENLDRFTLRLPQEIRKNMMNRALLNRTKSFAPRGYGYGEGSSRGGRSFQRIDRNTRSDRWGLSRAVPFFSRASSLSLRSPKVVAADNSEGSTTSRAAMKSTTTMRLPSFKCLEPKSADETGLIQSKPGRLPV